MASLVAVRAARSSRLLFAAFTTISTFWPVMSPSTTPILASNFVLPA
jgi:hypothetical protein